MAGILVVHHLKGDYYFKWPDKSMGSLHCSAVLVSHLSR